MRTYLQKSLIYILLLSTLPAAHRATAQATPSATTSAILIAAEAQKILPATVFFRGLSAAVQARNSGGVRFGDGRLMLAALVDTSGYSTSVQEKYQAYLITESALQIGGHTLPPGAYGCGFIANDTFIVQDLGGHDLFTAPSTRDTALRRPSPLQIFPGEAGEYRFYTGRSFIAFRLAATP